ncbi:hypothetical protein [Chlorogloeopsis sp. ULAP02]|uniref:hypothetical protein n=1 Tax=Chlorogloeopsis sp. ULAP02 TaxID=3107926 RepID=UPI0031351A91
MDNPKIIEIYEKLPKLRREVLELILLGYSKTKIAIDILEGDEARVKFHRKEIYEDFDLFLKHIEPESKLSHLIILFYSETPNLMARLRVELGSPISSRNQLIRQFGEFLDELSKESKEYKFELHKVHKQEIPVLQALGRRYFNTQDHLPTKLLESWYEKDPNYFRKIINKNGKLVGFFIILFIKPKYFTDFALGKLIEREIDSSKVFAPEEFRESQEYPLYISVVAGESGHFVINTCILLFLAKYLDKIRELRTVNELYATAATEDRRDIMRDHLGFSVHIPASQRRDGEDFFVANLTSIKTSLFDYLVQEFPKFKRYASNIDLSNEDNWKPVYYQRKALKEVKRCVNSE